jgi:hypothetical protein
VLALSYQTQNVPATDIGPLQNITSAISDATKGDNLQIRLSYFGLCASRGDFWYCNRNGYALAAIGAFNDPLGLLSMAERYKSEVLFSGLM